MTEHKMMELIGEAREDFVQSAMETRGRKMSQRRHRGLSFVSKIAIVAAIIMSMATTVYATTGTLNIKSLISGGGKRYSSFEQINEAMEQAQVKFEAKESFANGYTFKSMNVGTTKGLDEDRNVLLTFKDLDITYTNPAGHRVSLSAHPYMESLSHGDTPVKESRLIGEVTVEYLESTYRMLPPEREGTLTEEEILWRDQPGNEISFGSDVHTPYETKVTQMRWVQNGVSYIFTDIQGNATADTLFAMAEELING